ncbi:hypothetical protein C2E20_9320, partial [Micractinium conductrix]
VEASLVAAVVAWAAHAKGGCSAAMAASASMPSLLQLDERLLSVPEEPSTSYGDVSAGRRSTVPAPAPRRWVDALEMMEAQARGEQLGAQLWLARSAAPPAPAAAPAPGRCATAGAGEVRERRLSRLPEAHMYVGRTPLTMADIRAWNTLQEQGCMDYELHANDCRHYINCLVKYTTGQDSAASATLQHRWRQGTAAGPTAWPAAWCGSASL